MTDEKWTDERVELLKKLWAEGLSASQVAARIGGITRNAVLSKVHRSGLPHRKTNSRKMSASTGQAWRNGRKRGEAPAAKKAPTAPQSPMAKVWATETDAITDNNRDDDVIPVADRIAISRRREDGMLEADDRLTDACCRWPIGEPRSADFHFCGKTKIEGLPYCEAHARRAYRAPQPKKQLGAVTVALKAKVTA